MQPEITPGEPETERQREDAVATVVKRYGQRAGMHPLLAELACEGARRALRAGHSGHRAIAIGIDRVDNLEEACEAADDTEARDHV